MEATADSDPLTPELTKLFVQLTKISDVLVGADVFESGLEFRCRLQVRRVKQDIGSGQLARHQYKLTMDRSILLTKYLAIMVFLYVLVVFLLALEVSLL